mmetsp:Transcript_3471/g.15849  ORF Transcript_3471/g.15849 Transcript_3471/m.15849 type:complete len:200 (+) Transcript_3471:3133-3732(+)
MTPAPAPSSRGTRPPVRSSSTASTSSTPRAKTWWRAFEPRRTSISSSQSSLVATRLWSTGATGWKTTSGTSWTSSSRSSPTSSGSSSAALVSGSAPPRSRSRATWSTRVSSPSPERFSWWRTGTWTSCCGRGSTRPSRTTERRTSLRRVCPHRPAPRSEPSCSPRLMPRLPGNAARTAFWSGWRRAPRTSAVCTPALAF